MRPPRLKLRTLIVLVALATLAVGAVEYRRRAVRYRALAAQELHAEQATRTQNRVYVAMSARFQEGPAGACLVVAEQWERLADHHARRRAAFRRCARYPWLSPPADEPKPR